MNIKRVLYEEEIYVGLEDILDFCKQAKERHLIAGCIASVFLFDELHDALKLKLSQRDQQNEKSSSV